MRKAWDWLLFAQIITIGVVSITIIFSINRTLAYTQAIYWVLGLSVLYVVSNFDYRLWVGQSKKIYALTIVALVMLLLFVDPIRGARQWFDFGLFRVQPSEIAKVATVLLLANFFKNKSAKDLTAVFISFLLILLPATLIIMEPDIGNSLTIFAVWLGITIASGLRFRHLFALVLTGAVVVLIFYELLAPYQKGRVLTYLNPNTDPLGTGYNIIQSKIAIGAGQFFGRGFLQGTQSQLYFLPEAESDFIFASITEQLGLAGASILILIFVWLALRIMSFTKDKDRAGQLILIGVATFLVAQFTVNVGMNLALLPVTGITFPLVSYGGSSLLTTLFLLGLVISVKRFNR